MRLTFLLAFMSALWLPTCDISIFVAGSSRSHTMRTPITRTPPIGIPGFTSVCQAVRASDGKGPMNQSKPMDLAESHYVCVPPPGQPRRGGFLYLGAACSNAHSFLRTAADSGYDSICLSWHNSPGSECACGLCLWQLGKGTLHTPTTERCEHHIELARLFGQEDDEAANILNASAPISHSWAHIDHRLSQAEAIAGRLLSLLRMLAADTRDEQAQSSPYAAITGSFWRQYIHTDAQLMRPRFESITIAGHSRGTIYGILLAQRYVLPRVLLFDGPSTNVLGNPVRRTGQKPADWLLETRLMTPADRFFGLTCTYGGCLGCHLAQLLWDHVVHIPGAAAVSNASLTSTGHASPAHPGPRGVDFGHALVLREVHGAHQIYDSDICRFEPPSGLSHSCLIGEQLDRPDRVPPRDIGRDFSALELVWRYMFTATVTSDHVHGAAIVEATNRTSATICPRFAVMPSGYNLSRRIPLRR